MKVISIVAFMLLITTAYAQNELSETRIIRLHLKNVEAHPLKVYEVVVSEVIIVGPEKDVIDFYRRHPGLMTSCNCLLLSLVQCRDYLTKLEMITQLAGSDKGPSTVSAELPNPEDFNKVYNKIQHGKTETCEGNACLKMCTNQICVSVECENELELCYNGSFSVSISNGQSSVVAELK